MEADDPSGEARSDHVAGRTATPSVQGLLEAVVNAAPVTFGAICAGFAGGAVIALSVGAHPTAGLVGAALFGFPAMLFEKHVVNREGSRPAADTD